MGNKSNFTLEVRPSVCRQTRKIVMEKRVNLFQLILKRRTIRLFKNKKVPFSLLKKVVESARRAPSAANRQFLEYLVVDKEDLKAKIFPCTKWAGYVYPKRVPPPEKRPSAYIIILINKNKSKKIDLRDVGAAVENILLSLVCFGLGGCWLGAIDKRRLRKVLNVPSCYKIDSLVAVGFPAESPILEEKNDVKYWLDEKNHLHVPKRPLKTILHYNKITFLNETK